MRVTVITQGLGVITKELANFEKKETQHVRQVVKGAAIFCTGKAKKNLSRPYPQGAIDTGQLRDSITYEEIIESESITCRVGTNVLHAPFIELGTKPHFPPLGDENTGLIRWVIRHMGAAKGKTPVFGKVKKAERADKARSIAFAIAKKIAKYGIPQKPFLRPAFTEAKQKLIQDLERMKK